ncbi:tRNA-dihydrouridine synthase [uncultured Desulfovibrio sp.]|uniref:tRNA dihydrouridine synthase n=1 Tax=uncultured Desulfovibrio sp. TaxID=167968 RepID=UPI0026167A91|nr:tRNA-dihydrouridine synthase family protein [uncultured Desulfovibrio sp.]
MTAAFAIPPCPGPVPDALPLAADAPWLAPLAGYSDLPFRLLCRRYGAAVCVTEMVSAKGLVYGSPGTGDLLRSLPEDQPLVVQLFGAEASFLGRAAALLRDAGYGWFDLNMGCSVHKVVKQGAGAAMLRDPENALDAARALIAAAGPGRVGFKLRLGFDESHRVCNDLALRLQDLGAGWITLHPRTARQGFGGVADHEAVAELVRTLSIPVIASGDLFSARDGIACIRATGAHTVMYARGALQNPAIFRDHAELLAGRDPAPADPARLAALIARHMALLRRFASPEHPDAAVWKMRSVVPRYVKHLPGAKALRLALCRCHTWDDVHAALTQALGPLPADVEE